jgi:hypothetical protein
MELLPRIGPKHGALPGYFNRQRSENHWPVVPLETPIGCSSRCEHRQGGRGRKGLSEHFPCSDPRVFARPRDVLSPVCS